MGSGLSRLESFPVELAADEGHLRLMATADLHMTLAPWDYHADAPGGPPGLAGAAALAARLRAGAGASLLFDCGDFLQGGPMGDHFALDRAVGAGATHPMIAAMNAAGIDAATLGNHEFDYGLPFLERALAQARFPVLATNLVRRLGPTPLQDTPLLAPRAIRTLTLPLGDGRASPLRLGLIGLCPPQVLSWAGARLGGRLAARDMLEAATAHAAALRAEGADLVVALVHDGIGPSDGAAAEAAPVLPLARDGGIDVLFLGHAHEVFPPPPAPADATGRGPLSRPDPDPGADPGAAFGPCPGPTVDRQHGRLGGRPAVMPGAHGSHLGVVDLVLRRTAGGQWQQRRTEVRALPVPPPPPSEDCTVRRTTRAAHRATRAHMSRPIGRTARPLHSHFAMIADSPALRLVAAAQRRWARAALGDRPEAGLPIVVAVAPFRAGGPAGPQNFTRIPPGPLLLRHLHDLCGYANHLQLLRLTGADIRAWLERSAGLYARLAPDRPDTTLLLPGAAAYNCDILDGLGYAIDLGASARHGPDGRPSRPAEGGQDTGRIRRLTLDGRPLHPQTPVLLVSNDFRTGGGGRFPGARPESVVLASRQTPREALRAHIEALGTLTDPPHGPGWGLTAPPGSTALFDTGPAAADHLQDIARLSPEPLGLTARGFLRLRLHFP